MLLLFFRLYLFIYSYGLPYIILNIIGIQGEAYNKNLILSTFILFVIYNSILNIYVEYLKNNKGE